MTEQFIGKKKLNLSLLIKIVKDTGQGFIDDSVTRLSGSLAYATLFSIIPFLSLLVTIGVALHMDLANQLYIQLEPIVGAEVIGALRLIIEGNYIGADNKESLTIIDLSLLPSDVTSIVTAVIARMVFEAQQRYLRLNKQCLPTVLVMEEAHYFVKRYNDDAENTGPTTQCCKVFEKIAREGRKFGLGLVLSSQRPSELSSTVLSQCNSFLLHRISNDRDQELVHRLLPDNMRGILREMPSLPSQYAVLLGWASELPIMVKMRTLPKNQCPQSDDPDYWDVWTRLKECKIDWGKIADEWQNKKDDMPTE